MERIDYEDLDRRLKSPDWRFEMDRDELRLLFTLAGSSVSRELYEARWREREAVIKQRNEAIAERDNLRKQRDEAIDQRLTAANASHNLRKQNEVLRKECNTMRQQRDEAREACTGHEPLVEAMRKRMVHLLHECRGKIMGIAAVPGRRDALAWADDQLASMGEPIVKTVGEPVVIDEGLNARSKRLRAAGATPSIMVCGVSQVTVSHRWLDDGTLCITLADVKPS
jgi:hypothetical protein